MWSKLVLEAQWSERRGVHLICNSGWSGFDSKESYRFFILLIVIALVDLCLLLSFNPPHVVFSFHHCTNVEELCFELNKFAYTD